MMDKPIFNVLTVVFLGVALLIVVGCSDSDRPTTESEMREDTHVDANLTGSLSGHVEAAEETEISLRLLRNGEVIVTATAEADGNYRIDNLKPDTYTVEITAKGFEGIERTVEVAANQTVLLEEITLKALQIPVAHLRGLLQNQATKQGLAKVPVQLIDVKGQLRETITTDTGIFSFENLPVNEPLILKVALEGYEAREVDIDAIPEDETAKVTVGLMQIIGQNEEPPGEGLSVGVSAPNFTLPDGDGKNHSLADYAGQKVVLLFDRGRW